MKLFYQYMSIFFNFSPTASHLYPLQAENCDRFERVKALNYEMSSTWSCFSLRDAPLDIWDGGGGRRYEKKVCRHKKIAKKSLLKMWTGKKFVDKIFEKICWPEYKEQICNLKNRDGIRQDLIFSFFHEKSLSKVHRPPPQKKCFLPEVKQNCNEQ